MVEEAVEPKVHANAVFKDLQFLASRYELLTILPNFFYWVALDTPPEHLKSIVWFSAENVLVYEPFYLDFGPLDLGQTYRYCQMALEKLKSCKEEKTCLIHYCGLNPTICTNAAYLASAFQIIILSKTAEEAYSPFNRLKSIQLLKFVDASAPYGPNKAYFLSVYESLKGLEYAISLGWFNFDTFNLEEYEYYSREENGNMNWIIPNKFLAFSNPITNVEEMHNISGLAVQDYIPIFQQFGIKTVIRLSLKTYDRSHFVEHNIAHHDLYFPDGTCPTKGIIQEFMQISDDGGPIAIHCQAGLGRTGSLMGCYAIERYRFPAMYWIGWNRICRPGSIFGIQQNFLQLLQEDVFASPIPAFSPLTALYRTVAPNCSIDERLEKVRKMQTPQKPALSKKFRCSGVYNLNKLLYLRSRKSETNAVAIAPPPSSSN